MNEIPPPGSDWVRPTSGQQQVCKAEPYSSEVQHSLTAGEQLGNWEIHGAAGSVQCLEDAGQGGQADKQHSHLYISEIIDTDLSPQSKVNWGF